MAKSTKNAKSGQQAATKASAQQAPATTGKKVAKVATKATKQAPAKVAKPKATKSGQQARRGIATSTIRLTKDGRAHEGYRGARGECWKLVAKNDGKPASNVIGKTYAGRDGERAFDGSFLAFFAKEGLIDLG